VLIEEGVRMAKNVPCLKFEGKEICLEKDVILIGRSSQCDIVLANPYISARHARIRHDAGRYILEDLGSKNGTYVNGREVRTPHVLRHGDEISLAKAVTLSFIHGQGTATTALLPERSGLWIDKELREVWVEGERIDPPLSVVQFRLLLHLYENMGKPCSRTELINAVWPEYAEEGVSDAAIDSLVSRLRRRIAELDPHHQYIVTMRGYGFKLVNKRW